MKVVGVILQVCTTLPSLLLTPPAPHRAAGERSRDSRLPCRGGGSQYQQRVPREPAAAFETTSTRTTSTRQHAGHRPKACWREASVTLPPLSPSPYTHTPPARLPLHQGEPPWLAVWPQPPPPSPPCWMRGGACVCVWGVGKNSSRCAKMRMAPVWVGAQNSTRRVRMRRAVCSFVHGSGWVPLFLHCFGFTLSLAGCTAVPIR